MGGKSKFATGSYLNPTGQHSQTRLMCHKGFTQQLRALTMRGLKINFDANGLVCAQLEIGSCYWSYHVFECARGDTTDWSKQPQRSVVARITRLANPTSILCIKQQSSTTHSASHRIVVPIFLVLAPPCPVNNHALDDAVKRRLSEPFANVFALDL